jgi:hypothetical protein
MCKRFTLIFTVVVRSVGGCHRAFFVGAEFLKDLHEFFHADAAGVVFICFLLGFRGALQESLDDGAVVVLISVAKFPTSFLVLVLDFRYSHAVRRIRVLLCQLGRDVEGDCFAGRSTRIETCMGRLARFRSLKLFLAIANLPAGLFRRFSTSRRHGTKIYNITNRVKIHKSLA